ncbi:MAG: 30S ribosomal protein S5, partial [Oscillatoriales cyanobacterium]
MAEQKEQRNKKKSNNNKGREKESEWQERVVQIRRV